MFSHYEQISTLNRVKALPKSENLLIEKCTEEPGAEISRPASDTSKHEETFTTSIDKLFLLVKGKHNTRIFILQFDLN